MKVEKLNENDEKINQVKDLYKRLNMAFTTQTKDIQMVVQPLLSQIVWLDDLLDDTRNRIKPYNIGSDGKMSEEVQAYLKMLDKYNEIIIKLIDILKK